jgi:hypothetical protein
MERGELVRTLPDGTRRYLPFNLAKALAGDPEHSLLLEDRDTLELYRIGDLRLPLTLGGDCDGLRDLSPGAFSLGRGSDGGAEGGGIGVEAVNQSMTTRKNWVEVRLRARA